MALINFKQWVATHPDSVNEMPTNTIWAQGIGTFEWYPVQIDPATGLLQTTGSGGGGGSSGLGTAGAQGAITVGGTATAANVSGTNLASRTLLTVYNNSGDTLYWGFANTVTTAGGTPIANGQTATWNILDSLSVYLISSGTTSNVRVTEAY